MKSVMKHQFSQVPRAEIPRSTFNRSHGYKTTFDAGGLVPILVDEALPGDTFNVRSTLFARLNTPVAPFMDNLHMDTFYFAVPLRLIWDNFQKFMGEQANPGDSTDYVTPKVEFTDSIEVGTNWDYFGIRPGPYDPPITAFASRALHLIFNEWFRDQNLQQSVLVDKDDGPDEAEEYSDVLHRGKRHDYFTSALPWPQKGPGVELPLGTEAPIVFEPTYPNFGTTMYDADDGSALTTGSNLRVITSTGLSFVESQTDGVFVTMDNADQLKADLTNATAATINSLRQAFQLQKLYERDARGGTRYTEIVRSHFGTVSPDARLQRPEYLGGTSAPVQITQVPQTSSTDGTSPQGNLAAFGTVMSKGGGFTKSFTEHCMIIGLVNVWADLTYQQGINRMWFRNTRFDYYWPALAHLGEQAILNREIFYQGTSADDDVFGYNERWSEYRYKPSLITGQLRSDYAQSLDIWHLSQDFVQLPLLNAAFIQEQPPLDRVVATPSEPHFILDVYHDMKCVRPLPTYSVPGMLDHF